MGVESLSKSPTVKQRRGLMKRLHLSLDVAILTHLMRVSKAATRRVVLNGLMQNNQGNRCLRTNQSHSLEKWSGSTIMGKTSKSDAGMDKNYGYG